MQGEWASTNRLGQLSPSLGILWTAAIFASLLRARLLVSGTHIDRLWPQRGFFSS